MSFLQQLIELLKSLLMWWVIVEPWEQAVRVRFGKNVSLLHTGVHFKLPLFDVFYKQNVRRRVCDIPLTTLSTSDGVTISVHSSLGYAVRDVLKLHNTLQDAELAVKQEALGCVSRFVTSHTAAECAPGAITAYVGQTIDLEKYGLAEVDFFVSGFVRGVRTYRLINDGMYSYLGKASDLTTLAPDQVPK